MDRSDLRSELHRVLDLAYATGRIPTGAWVKQQLTNRTEGFDESDFGHASFLDLLQSFSDLVQITEQEGSDFIVRLRDQPELFPVSEMEAGGVPYIRSDLWEAFAFVRDEGGWVYDLEKSNAVPQGKVYEAGDEDSDRYVTIPPLKAEELRTWMTEFADAWPDDTVSSGLSEALAKEDDWLRSFNGTLRSFDPQIRQAWRRKRAFRVIQRIREWADENEIEMGTIVEPPEKEPHESADRAGDTATSTMRAETQRERILSILEQAPTAELLQIRLPVGLVLDLDSD